jgi:hypothetical protein
MGTSLLAIVGTLAGTVVGFGVNEASYILRTRRDDRLRLGRVLNELLEIRSQTKMVPTVMELIRSRIPAALPPAADFALRQAFRAVLSGLTDQMQARYSQAVSEVSGAFPILAYRLRSKDILVSLLKQLSPFVPATDATAVEAWVKMEEELTHATLPVLEELIRSVASMCGRTVRKETDAILRRQFEPPKALDRFFSQVLAAAAKGPPIQPPPATPDKPGSTGA